MTLKLLRTYRTPLRLPKPVVCAVGNFDGVHLGHQALLEMLDQRRREIAGQQQGRGSTLIVSFYPHPVQILRGKVIPSITSLRQKVLLLERYKVDVLLLIRFTQAFSELGAQEFVDDLLIKRFQVQHLLLGPDAAFGRGREGTSAFISEAFSAHGRRAEIISVISHAEQKIGSGVIRELLSKGDVDQGAALLGRPFALLGRVVKGAGLGRKLGFPTANFKAGHQILPADGVYATRAGFAGACYDKRYDSVTSIGCRETFGQNSREIETFLLDYCGPDFYGERLEVEFLSRIRKQERFNSPAELTEQMRKDVAEARKRLSALP